AAARILGEGFGGTPVTRVLVERLVDIADQLYAAITLDRSKKCYVAMVSAKGGIDIEEIARDEPLAIRRSAIDPMLGLHGFQTRANEAGLQHVELDGEVEIIGNGAGLVMSTLDAVSQAGGRPANFLDLGGGASADSMATSLEVVLSDPGVRAVLVNIFGGITRGELVAAGILEALRRVDPKVP